MRPKAALRRCDRFRQLLVGTMGAAGAFRGTAQPDDIEGHADGRHRSPCQRWILLMAKRWWCWRYGQCHGGGLLRMRAALIRGPDRRFLSFAGLPAQFDQLQPGVPVNVQSPGPSSLSAHRAPGTTHGEQILSTAPMFAAWARA
jgi:hypothetical protein